MISRVIKGGFSGSGSATVFVESPSVKLDAITSLADQQ